MNTRVSLDDLNNQTSTKMGQTWTTELETVRILFLILSLPLFLDMKTPFSPTIEWLFYVTNYMAISNSRLSTTRYHPINGNVLSFVVLLR